MKIIFALILLFVVLLGPVGAQLSEIGIDPLRIEVGGRPLGMGGAFSGLADDMNAALYNPGGLAWVKGLSLTMKDIGNITAVQAYPTGYNSALGLAVITKQLSNIPVATGVANSSGDVVYVSYGTKLTFLPQLSRNQYFQHVGIGINVKGLMGQTLRREGELDRSATGWDMDLGVLWKGAEWWSAGLTLQNILPAGSLGGGQINWDVGAAEGFKAVGKLAGAARLIGDIGSPVFMEGRELLLAGEVDFALSRPILMRLGGEWNIEKKYYFRSGIMQQYKGAGMTSDINLGLGIRFARWGFDVATYREPVLNEQRFYLSFNYFPKEWIVIKRLDMNQPMVMLEKAIESLSLKNNIVTYEDRIEVVGKVKSGVDVLVNGAPASVKQDNSFKVMVPLHLKKNLVLVEARYGGEKKVWKYKVLRKIKIAIAEEKQVEAKIKAAKTVEEKEKLQEEVKELEAKREQVESLVTMGVIEVTPEAEFELDSGVTRGELATWLVKAAEMQLPDVEKDVFVDVPKDHPLAPYIKVVDELKLLRPFPDGTFRPGAVVSKEEGDEIFARFGVTQ
ncbi:S-layer homology domain-containing protein [Candidatus Margulisiibacteriota bacterium]